jgi:hypothetical protein
MDIYNTQGKRLRLKDNDFLTEGGEGKLYALGGRVVKLYHEPNKVIAADKLDRLARLDRPNIIRPLEFVFDHRGDRIGFIMRKVNSAVALPRLFTTAYWNANGITPEKITRLITGMQDTIAFIHQHRCLQVDGNEFNYMTKADLSTAYFIDVDSYQTPGHPATAIMPSIRDYTQLGFNESTDWFSFAIVAFQLFTGIHPYKGRHPDFKSGDFQGRVKAGISVFHPDVTYPPSVRSFSVIPPMYLHWFQEVFAGTRTAPPSGQVQVAVAPHVRTVRDGKRVTIKPLTSYPEAIRAFSTFYGQYVVRAGDYVFIGKRRYAVPSNTQGIVILENATPLFLSTYKGLLVATPIPGITVTLTSLFASRVFVVNNVPYVVHEDKLIELTIAPLGTRVVVSPGVSRTILPNATQVYTDIVLQNVLGKTHALLPVKPGVMPIIAVPELDVYRIIDARFSGGVAIFQVATQVGDYQTMRLRFTNDFTSYDVEIRSDIDDPLNFTVLEKGLIVRGPRAGTLEITPTSIHRPEVRLVDDVALPPDLHLANDNGQVIFSAGSALYALSLNP